VSWLFEFLCSITARTSGDPPTCIAAIRAIGWRGRTDIAGEESRTLVRAGQSHSPSFLNAISDNGPLLVPIPGTTSLALCLTAYLAIIPDEYARTGSHLMP